MRKSSPGKGSGKNTGPETGAKRSIFGEREKRRPHDWDRTNGGGSKERCGQRGRRGQVTEDLEGCGEGFRFYFKHHGTPLEDFQQGRDVI